MAKLVPALELNLEEKFFFCKLDESPGKVSFFLTCQKVSRRR